MRFVVWIWKGNRQYEPEHVNRLYRQLDRHCHGRFSLLCISDETRGFDSGIEVMKTPQSALKLADLRTPEKPNFPSCYRRLWMFSKEAQSIGERVMLIDVDLVFTADPSPLFERQEDFVGWRPLRTWGVENRFGGGVYLLRTGTRSSVWTDFTGPESIAIARRAGLRGSDQAWLSYCLAGTEASWPKHCGIYSIRDFTCRPKTVRRHGEPLGLPSDAIMVHFNGPDKPWSRNTQARHRWLEAHA